MNHYILSFDYYSAFLAKAAFEPNDLARAFRPYEKENLEEDLKMTEGIFHKNGLMTNRGNMIAKVLAQPLKTIMVNFPTSGKMDFVVFCYNLGFWVVADFNFEKKVVDLIAPILQQDINGYIKDTFLGKWQTKPFDEFRINLNIKELALYNLILLTIQKRAKQANRSLTKEESMFTLKDLISNDEIAALMAAEKLSDLNTLSDLLSDEKECDVVWAQLLQKQIAVYVKEKNCYLPGDSFKRLMPNYLMFSINFCDVTSKNNRNYKIFAESMLEVTEQQPNNFRFQQVSDFDYSMWNTSNLENAVKNELFEISKIQTVKPINKELQPSTQPSQPSKTTISAEPPVSDVSLPTLEINFCPNCGTKIAPGARFCHQCGTDFRALGVKG